MNKSFSKGHSTNIIEEKVINKFRQKFLEDTFEEISNISLSKLAVHRANKAGSDPDEELEKVRKEFDMLGQLAFSFDSGTSAAIKQMRHKLLMANAGSVNFEMDEIASNLMANTEALNVFLELYDVGKVKQKLTKNTHENVRNVDLDGRTPTNLMLFGTPDKLFNGGKQEEEFISMQDTGYGRRCFFGYADLESKDATRTPQQVYDMLTDKSSVNTLNKISDYLGNLADIINFNKDIRVTKEVALECIEYQLKCEKIANALPAHDGIRKAEITHRYFKCLKIAGTYAFIDGKSTMEMEHLYNAIKLTEDSGNAFDKMMRRKRNYIRIAEFIADVDKDLTNVDLMEELPCYKGSEAQKREMMSLATAYGYKNNIIIQRYISEGIEFISGSTLKEATQNECIISYSKDSSTGFKNKVVAFNKLNKLFNNKDKYTWTTHHSNSSNRTESEVAAGFNVVSFRIASGISIKAVRELMSQYSYIIYSDEDSTTLCNKFTLVLPISHTLYMNNSEFTEFMNIIYEWLPFTVSKDNIKRSTAWKSNNDELHFNDGKQLNALSFIPRTTKAEKLLDKIKKMKALDNLQRWFVNSFSECKIEQLKRYANILVIDGMGIDSVKNNVLDFNSKLTDKLTDSEVLSTVLVSTTQQLQKRG